MDPISPKSALRFGRYLTLDDLRNAIINEVIPDLEQLSKLPDGAQFELGLPPSAATSVSEATMTRQAMAKGLIPDPDFVKRGRRLQSITARPFSEEEATICARWGRGGTALRPARRFKYEFEVEKRRIAALVLKCRPWTQHILWKDWFRTREQRVSILARRNIRRFWQSLGVWNSEWGIPRGRNPPQPNDDPEEWKWKWPVDERPGTENVLIMRALRARVGLRYGEHKPPPPVSHPKEETSLQQFEEFLLSRPWFTYQIEHWEKHQREHRVISMSDGSTYPMAPMFPHSVEKAWEDRGDLNASEKDDQGLDVPETSWKWRHESPEPEREDLFEILNQEPEEGRLAKNWTAALEMTPSEVDAWEKVPETPLKQRWKIRWGIGEDPLLIDREPADNKGQGRVDSEVAGDEDQRPPDGEPTDGEPTDNKDHQPVKPNERRSARLRAIEEAKDKAKGPSKPSVAIPALAPQGRGRKGANLAEQSEPAQPSTRRRAKLKGADNIQEPPEPSVVIPTPAPAPRGRGRKRACPAEQSAPKRRRTSGPKKQKGAAA